MRFVLRLNEFDKQIMNTDAHAHMYAQARTFVLVGAHAHERVYRRTRMHTHTSML